MEGCGCPDQNDSYSNWNDSGNVDYWTSDDNDSEPEPELPLVAKAVLVPMEDIELYWLPFDRIIQKVTVPSSRHISNNQKMVSNSIKFYSLVQKFS